MKTIYLHLGSLALGLVFSSKLFACGFQVDGLNKENEPEFRKAMQEITSEFKLNLEAGEIQFTSKDIVSLEQVESALRKSELQSVAVKSIHH